MRKKLYKNTLYNVNHTNNTTKNLVTIKITQNTTTHIQILRCYKHTYTKLHIQNYIKNEHKFKNMWPIIQQQLHTLISSKTVYASNA